MGITALIDKGRWCDQAEFIILGEENLMSIETIYEDGVFKPIGKVDLPEHSRVRVEFVQLSDDSLDRAVESAWSLHLVKRVAADFDDTPPGFEEHVGS